MSDIISHFPLNTRCSERSLFLNWGVSVSQEHLPNPRSRVLLEKLPDPQLVKKFPALYGTRRLITEFTSARHLSPSCAILIRSMPPQPTSWKPILILSSQLRLGLPSGSFPKVSPPKPRYTHFLSPIRATCPFLLVLLNLITRIILGDEYRSLSSSLCSFLHSPLPHLC